jgi:hypothetical protein
MRGAHAALGLEPIDCTQQIVDAVGLLSLLPCRLAEGLVPHEQIDLWTPDEHDYTFGRHSAVSQGIALPQVVPLIWQCILVRIAHVNK